MKSHYIENDLNGKSMNFLHLESFELNNVENFDVLESVSKFKALGKAKTKRSENGCADTFSVIEYYA